MAPRFAALSSALAAADTLAADPSPPAMAVRARRTAVRAEERASVLTSARRTACLMRLRAERFFVAIDAKSNRTAWRTPR